MTRTKYQSELLDIESAVCSMGAQVEHVLADAAVVMVDWDTLLALRLLHETSAAAVQRSIRERCLEVMACQAPVAGDLRQLVAIQVVISELERISDNALEIAQHAARLRRIAQLPDGVEELRKLAVAMCDHIDLVLHALSARDAQKARLIIVEVGNFVGSCAALMDRMREALSGTLPHNGHADLLLIAAALGRVGHGIQVIGSEILDLVGRAARQTMVQSQQPSMWS